MSSLLTASPQALNAAQFLRLVAAASRAPSGDNKQPWAFRHTETGIDVLHRRRLALPSDVHDLFSWLSLGAVIENIVLAAGHDGLAADVDYCARPFGENNGDELVANIRLSSDRTAVMDDLALSIDHRCTNRRPYDPQPLDARTLDRIGDSIHHDVPPVQWLTCAAEKQQLARLVVAADRVRFESRPFHDEFHAVLRYTPREAEATRDGLDIRTFEAPPGASLIFRCLAPWRRMQFANRLGMSRILAAASHKLVLRSGAIGLLCAPADNDTAFLQTGRSLQRLWLAATREGLAFQPLGALPLFLLRLQLLGEQSFPPAQLRAMRALQAPFAQLFPTAKGVPVLLFRIGRAPAPSARSLRYRPGALIAGNSQ